MSPFHVNKVSFIYPLQILLLEISLLEILLLDKLLLEIQLQETEGLKNDLEVWKKCRNIILQKRIESSPQTLVHISLQFNVVDLRYFKL